MSLLDKLENFAESAMDSLRPFDPSGLNDEIAMKTEWQAMRNGGSNFSTHKLTETTDRKMEYKPTLMAYVFPSIFILAFTIGGFIMGANFVDKFGNIAYVFAAAFAIVPVGLGGYLLNTYIKPRVFDTNLGVYYKGKLPINFSHIEPNKNMCSLKDVHAIQLVKYRSTSTSSSNGSNRTQTYYETNLVLKDTYRINVSSGVDMYKVRKDAARIAALLNVPLWDGI